jgi:hypothetical protein
VKAATLQYTGLDSRQIASGYGMTHVRIVIVQLGSASHLVPWLNSSSAKKTHTQTHIFIISYPEPETVSMHALE